MAWYCLILLSLFVPFFLPIYAQTFPSGKLAHLQNGRTILLKADSKNDMEVQMYVTLLQSPETPKTTDSISQKGHPLIRHHQRHLRSVHWILTLIGWGTLVPIGVMVARYCRKFPMQCDEWYSFHTVCQTGGYILGTVGWCIGMWLGSSSKRYASKTQRILSIIAFTFISFQMLSIFVRTRKESYIKWWRICHHILGYAVVAIIIANILEGINNQSEDGKLKWVYVSILAVLAITALSLEIFRCIKSGILNQSMQLTSSMYTGSP